MVVKRERERFSETLPSQVHGRQLYTFMMDMMRAYYSTHPDYAQQHPDPSLIPSRQDNYLLIIIVFQLTVMNI